MGSFVRSTFFSTTSWHAPFSKSFGGKGFSIARDSFGSNCSLVVPMDLAIKSLEETKPATTGMMDSLIFSKKTGFSPSASMMLAISYSVETGLVIRVSSPYFWSCSMKVLKPKLHSPASKLTCDSLYQNFA